MPEAAPRRVVLYSAGHECPLCDRAKAALESVARETGVAWSLVEVDGDPALEARYAKRVPVLSIDGRDAFEGRFDAAAIRRALAAR